MTFASCWWLSLLAIRHSSSFLNPAAPPQRYNSLKMTAEVDFLDMQVRLRIARSLV